jgi:flagellar basal body L-ring protein FlgH
VHLRDASGVAVGDIIRVRIEESDEADLFGVPV